jgi:hypothetical protein
VLFGDPSLAETPVAGAAVALLARTEVDRVEFVGLEEWIKAWTRVAEYTTADVPNVDQRISAVLKLWDLPVAEGWLRPAREDDMWVEAPYRRGDRDAPSSPERTIEHEILGPGSNIAAGRKCLGGAIRGGINAVPLTSTPKIEADLLLLVEHTNGPHLYLAEVKAMANTPWYATIELLRQLRLLLSGSPTWSSPGFVDT